MGVSLRLVCHTCKTVDDAGGCSDYLSMGFHRNTPSPGRLRIEVQHMKALFDTDNYPDITNAIGTLGYIAKWLEKHKDHITWVANERMMDMGDWEDYSDEQTGWPWSTYGHIKKYGKLPEGHKLTPSESLSGILSSIADALGLVGGDRYIWILATKTRIADCEIDK